MAQPFYRCIRFEVGLKKSIFLYIYTCIFSYAKIVKRLVVTKLAHYILISALLILNSLKRLIKLLILSLSRLCNTTSQTPMDAG